MKGTAKKRLLIVGIILVVLAVLGTVGFHFAVNRMFSKVTETIGESDLFKNESGELVLPVVRDGSGSVSKGESVTVQLNEENLQELEEEIPVNDKFAVLTILANALPAEEYSKLLSYAKDGISQEEYAECYAIMRENLTKEQKTQIKQYYGKYLHLLEE